MTLSQRSGSPRGDDVYVRAKRPRSVFWKRDSFPLVEIEPHDLEQCPRPADGQVLGADW
jgi:hypothetical protein